MPRGKRAAEEPKAQEKEEKQPAKGKKKKDDPKSKDEAAKAPSAAPAAPKPPTEEETVERVRVLDRGVRESRQNINNCVELVQILRESPYDTAVFRAAKALQRIFLSFKGEISLTLDWRPLPLDKVSSPEEVLANWLCKHHASFHDALVHLLGHKEPTLQVMALEMLREQLRAEEERRYVDEEERNPQKLFPFASVTKMIDRLLGVADFAPKLLEDLTACLDFDDVKLAALLALQPHAQRLATEAEKDQAKRELLESNVLAVLKLIIPRGGKESLEPFKYLHPITDEVIVHEKKDAHDFTAVKAHRKAASSVWLAYLRAPLSGKNFKEALAITHDHIIPSMADPRVLIDFLRNSYDKGGVVSILALHGLFVLIKDFNLDYPDFFKKLYALFEPTIFFVKYRDRFFRLAALFLSSTHMPAYIVASFVKRLARLALYGPPHAALICIPFMYNLIRRHPSCAVLIHRQPAGDQVLNLRVESTGNGSDPFSNEEKDFEQTHALDSSLWELELLSRHYHPNVARLAKVFEAGHLEKKNFDLDAFVQLSYSSEFASMANHKKGAYVPLANQLPGTLFAPTNALAKRAGLTIADAPAAAK